MKTDQLMQGKSGNNALTANRIPALFIGKWNQQPEWLL